MAACIRVPARAPPSWRNGSVGCTCALCGEGYSPIRVCAYNMYLPPTFSRRRLALPTRRRNQTDRHGLSRSVLPVVRALSSPPTPFEPSLMKTLAGLTSRSMPRMLSTPFTVELSSRSSGSAFQASGTGLGRTMEHRPSSMFDVTTSLLKLSSAAQAPDKAIPLVHSSSPSAFILLCAFSPPSSASEGWSLLTPTISTSFARRA